MLPIMDALANSIENDISRNINIEDIHIYIDEDQTKKIFKVLSDLGCHTSLEKNYEGIVKSDNSQENKEQ